MALTAACRAFLPSGPETDLLRACLWEGAAAGEAFERWSRLPEDALRMLQSDGGTKRRLLPLLSTSLESCGVEAPAAFGPLLHAAALYEQMRTKAYAEIAHTVLAELGASDITFLVTRGVCFAGSIYTATHCRHCNDIDLLVPDAAAGQTTAALLVKRCGFASVERANAGCPGRKRFDHVLVHTSGLPLLLHTAAVEFPAYALSWEMLKEEAVVLQAYGLEVGALSATDSLLQVILHALAGPHARSLVWVCDAWKLCASGGIDWGLLVARTAGGLMPFPLLLALEYLQGELGASVPAEAMEALRAPALGTEALEVVLFGVQALVPGGRKELLRRAGGWRDRLSLLRVMLLPTKEALVAAGRIEYEGEARRYRRARLFRGLLRLFGRVPRGIVGPGLRSLPEPVPAANGRAPRLSADQRRCASIAGRS